MTQSGRPERPKARGKRRAAILVASTILSLSCFEGGLRIAGFSFRFMPERSQVFDRVLSTENHVADPDLMWVTQDYATVLERAQDRTPNVVFTGDSVTYGNEWVIPFTQKFRAYPPHDMLYSANLSVPGFSSFQGILQFERDVTPLRPELVTAMYGWNDHWTGFGFELEDRAAVRLNRSLLYWVRNVRLIQAYNATMASRKSRRSGPSRRVPLDEFHDNLTDIVHMTHEVGASIVLLTAPTSHERGREPQELRGSIELRELVDTHLRYVDVVRKVADEQDVLLCDLYSHFAALPNRAEYFLDDGIHFTDDGGAVAAKSVFECFQRVGLVDHLVQRQQERRDEYQSGTN